jgi:hypothetical protein
MTTTHKLRHALLAAAALLALGSAQAANFSKAVYNGAKEDVKATYKAEREACNALSDNAKDICVKTAKGNESVALSLLEYNYTGKAKDEAKLYEAQYEARYELAKEKCDDLGGNDKDVCVRSAKTERDKAKSDLKLAKKVSSAADTAVAEHMKADYKLAKEKCDSLAGDAKDICVASAKARYNERW